MFHSTSGKMGYGMRYSPPGLERPEGGRVIPKSIMKKILQREDEMRFSSAYLNAISLHEGDLKWIRDVTVQMQKDVLREFGYDDAKGLMALNSARAEYIDDDEMNKLTVYQRMDRSRKGDLVKGDLLPNVALSTLDGRNITLHEYIEEIKKSRGGEDRPMVITAGSIT